MKNSFLSAMLFTAILVSAGCGSTSSLLSSGSSLMSALGGNPNLSTITSLLKTPGLDKVLGGAMKSPFTLLAPTNSAFDALGAGGVSNLTKPENLSQLGNLIKDHIVPGKLDAAAIAKGGLTTASGKPLNVAGIDLGSLMETDKANIIPVNKVLR